MLPIIVGKADLKKVTNLSTTSVWRLEKEGKFPKRRVLITGRVGWLYSEIVEWATNLRNSSQEKNNESNIC